MILQQYPKMKDSGIEWIGKVPEHWSKKKISWSFKMIGSGTTPDSGNVSYYDGDMPWVNSGDLNDGYVTMTSKTITKQALEDYSTLKIFPKGTLVIAMYGATIGKLGILGIPAATNQACCNLYGSKILETKFLFYWFTANREDIISQGRGGGQPNISQELIRSLVLQAPSQLEEQTSISEFLDKETSKIDADIQKNQKLIELLKEKKQATINRAVTKGLDPNIPMKDSCVEWIGEIPEHWQVKRLKFLKEGPLVYGANEVGEIENSGIRYIRITDVNIDGSLNVDTKLYLDEEKARPFLLEDGDILLARSGATVGKSFLYKKSCGKACFAGYLIKLKSNKKLLFPNFFYYYSQSPGYWDFIALTTIQATIQNVSAERYNNLWIPDPPIEEQHQISDFLDNETPKIDSLITKTENQIEKLQEYRNALISSVVTGKIDVRNGVVIN